MTSLKKRKKIYPGINNFEFQKKREDNEDEEETEDGPNPADGEDEEDSDEVFVIKYFINYQ